MKTKSLTNWDSLRVLSDKDIDTSDIPPLEESFFASAKLRLPQGKTLITIRLDNDVLDWLKSQGKGYQTRINAILRTYMEAVHR